MNIKNLIQKVLDYFENRQARKQDNLRKASNREQVKLILKDLQ